MRSQAARSIVTVILMLGIGMTGCGNKDNIKPESEAAMTCDTGAGGGKRTTMSNHDFEVAKSDDEWRAQLTPEQYRIARQGGTEPAFSGVYYKNKEPGIYRCVCCDAILFRAQEKYESGSGWPSFWAPAADAEIIEKEDRSLGMVRTEVMCGKCGAHLGHVFPDGPRNKTGMRYCINSSSLEFDPEAESEGP